MSALVELTAHPDLHEQVNLSAAAERTVSRLRLRDGSLISIDSVPYPAVTHYERDEGRVKALFMRRLGLRLGDSRAQAIIEAVEALDQSMGLEKLVHALSPPPSDRKGIVS